MLQHLKTILGTKLLCLSQRYLPLFAYTHAKFDRVEVFVNVTRFGKIRIKAATNYFCFFLLTGYTGPEDLDFQG